MATLLDPSEQEEERPADPSRDFPEAAVRHSHARLPDFRGISVGRATLSEARLRRYALDAIENRTYGTRSCAGIDGFHEIVHSAQVRVGRGPCPPIDARLQE